MLRYLRSLISQPAIRTPIGPTAAPAHESITEFEEFIHKETQCLGNLDGISSEEVNSFSDFMEKGDWDSLDIWSKKHPRQQIDYIALRALQQKRINSTQLATFLQRTNMRMQFPSTKTIPILTNGEISSEVSAILSQQSLGYYTANDDSYRELIEDADILLQRFVEEVKRLPKSEQFLFRYFCPDIPHEINNFFVQNKILLKGEKDTLIYMTCGARKARVVAVFGANAKDGVPKLGRFSINDIDDAMRKGKRPFAVTAHGTYKTETFHQLESTQFYGELHDEFHRILISSIPNNLYTAWFNAIDLIRRVTGVQWTHHLWNAVDLEFDVFLRFPENWASYEEKEYTENFVRMLLGDIATKKTPIGLFYPSPYCVTTWILLLDMANNPSRWLSLRIDPEYLGEYKRMYELIIQNQAILKGKPTVMQVAILYLTSVGKYHKFYNQENLSQDLLGVFKDHSLHFKIEAVDRKKIIVLGTSNVENTRLLAVLGTGELQFKVMNGPQKDDFPFEAQRHTPIEAIVECTIHRLSSFDALIKDLELLSHDKHEDDASMRAMGYSPPETKFEYPNTFNAYVGSLLTNGPWLRKVICTCSQLYGLVFRISDYKQQLGELIFADILWLKEIMAPDYELEAFVKIFPDHKARLAQLVFADLIWLKEIMNVDFGLMLIVTVFPERQGQLVKFLFADPAWLKQIISATEGMRGFVQYFPEHIPQLIKLFYSNQKIPFILRDSSEYPPRSDIHEDVQTGSTQSVTSNRVSTLRSTLFEKIKLARERVNRGFGNTETLSNPKIKKYDFRHFNTKAANVHSHPHNQPSKPYSGISNKVTDETPSV